MLKLLPENFANKKFADKHLVECAIIRNLHGVLYEISVFRRNFCLSDDIRNKFMQENNMLKAIMDRIIVRLDEDEPSPLFLGENKKTQNKGVVLSVGRQVSAVKPGDCVVFHRFDELPLPNEGLVVIREKSLLAVCEN